MYSVKQSPVLKSKLLIIRVIFLFIMLLVVLYAVETVQASKSSHVESYPILNIKLNGR